LLVKIQALNKSRFENSLPQNHSILFKTLRKKASQLQKLRRWRGRGQC